MSVKMQPKPSASSESFLTTLTIVLIIIAGILLFVSGPSGI
jgi:hypothetical protein